MKKLLILSTCSVIIFSWISVVAGVYPVVGTPRTDPASTAMTLLLLGVLLSVISFWGKRQITEE